MLNVRILAVTVLVASATMGSILVRAVERSTDAQVLVEYRLGKWKSICVEGSEYEKLTKTLKKLNCEVKIERHRTQTEVNYQCSKWQQLTLKDHGEAHQWERWLRTCSFETKHAH